MDFSGFIENLKTHEMEMKVREERRLQRRKLLLSKLLPPICTKIHPKMEMKTLPCSLGEWAKCSIREEDKATFEEEDLKEDSKRRRKRWVLVSLQEDRLSHCGLLFTSSHYLQEHA